MFIGFIKWVAFYIALFRKYTLKNEIIHVKMPATTHYYHNYVSGSSYFIQMMHSSAQFCQLQHVSYSLNDAHIRSGNDNGGVERHSGDNVYCEECDACLIVLD